MQYRTGIDSIPKVIILLVGNIGAGKSSVINTIDSALKGRISRPAEARPTPDTTVVTKRFSVYKPGGRRCGELGFSLCDTKGMELDEAGLTVEDMVYVLDGNIPNDFLFSDDCRITPDVPGFVRTPSLAQRIHCVAIIIDGAQLSLSLQYKRKFWQIIGQAGARGIALVIFVTKIDDICQLVANNVTMAHKSVAVKEAVEEISHMTSIDVSQIFPVKNYTSELVTSDAVDVHMLTALSKSLDFADDCLEKISNS